MVAMKLRHNLTLQQSHQYHRGPYATSPLFTFAHARCIIDQQHHCCWLRRTVASLGSTMRNSRTRTSFMDVVENAFDER
jgi:hypothetical protein